MKIRITATAIVNSNDYNESDSTMIKDFNENNGELAFEQLQEVASSYLKETDFKCVAEKVKE